MHLTVGYLATLTGDDGAALAGALATAYSFPVSLATLAAICLLTAVATLISSFRAARARPNLYS